MENLSACVVSTGSADHPEAEGISSILQAKGVDCCRQPGQHCKVVILCWMEKTTFEGVTEQLQQLCNAGCKVIVLCVKHSSSDILKWQLMQAGANDVITWSDSATVTGLLISRIKRWKLIDDLVQSSMVQATMIGESSTWKKFLGRVIEAAWFTNHHILLMGESGTGKEMTAGLIHALDQRKEKEELILLDCTTIVPELSGSEFYGHEKGAFTNAIYTRDGAFALANKGTLFLDELGELPLPLQAGLLRVIQEGTYKRVGSNTWNKTNFRLITATNRNLKAEITKGNFREDLYFRIASAVLMLPSLKERREDIPELARYFLRQELKCVVAPEIDNTVMNYLVSRDYPGNVRELKQLMARIAMRYTGEGFISMGDIPEDELPDVQHLKQAWNQQHQSLQQSIRLAIASGKDLLKIKNDIAMLAMEIALEDCGGNLKLAARKLNVEVRTLQYIRKRNEVT
ncbi:MAG: sigma-54-dependent Fis family transcriptional regulator [Niastella sp.]|nr:sigma-54-dependent Fis family transcriptional regulator [Niastella sp.]